MRIFAGVSLWAGASNDIWGSRRRLFLALDGLVTSSKTPAILDGGMLPLVGVVAVVGRQLLAKWMTLNDLERLFNVKIRFLPAFLESERLNVKNKATSAILRCSVGCALRDHLASLGRRTRLTRCFSTVAELHVWIHIPFAVRDVDGRRERSANSLLWTAPRWIGGHGQQSYASCVFCMSHHSPRFSSQSRIARHRYCGIYRTRLRAPAIVCRCLLIFWTMRSSS